MRKFITYLDKSQKIGDLACKNGNGTRYVAQYVGKIDGFEYSESMVQTARKVAEKQGIENILFYQADACELELECAYDNFMMMGLMT